MHVSHFSFLSFVSSNSNKKKNIFVLFSIWTSLIRIVSEQSKRERLIQRHQTWKLNRISNASAIRKYIKTCQALRESIQTMVNILDVKINGFFFYFLTRSSIELYVFTCFRENTINFSWMKQKRKLKKASCFANFFCNIKIRRLSELR